MLSWKPPSLGYNRLASLVACLHDCLISIPRRRVVCGGTVYIHFPNSLPGDQNT